MSALTLDAAIAQLSVSGLTIKSLSQIPDVDYSRDCPVMHPDPSGWLGQQSATPGNFDNVIAGRIQNTIALNYRLLVAQAGEGRGLLDWMYPMATLTLAIRKEIFSLDLVAMSIRQVNISQFGEIQDPSGKTFYGSLITVTALELETRGV
jgi:hypothetical protein